MHARAAPAVNPAPPNRATMAAAHAPASRATSLVASLQFDALLGEGSRGHVYAAMDADGTQLAVKVVPRDDD